MRSRSVILLLAATLAVPSLAMAWGAKGSLEPDTTYDKTAGFQWSTTDTTPCTTASPTLGCSVNRVYLNGFITQNADSHFDHGTSTLNPNVQTVGTAHPSWMGQGAALLGVWKDCNNDGYIGLGDNGLLEYRTEILANLPAAAGGVGLTICPTQSTSGAPAHDWFPIHNDGTWVHEFLPLGPDKNKATLADANKWNLNDQAARIWMDWKYPGELPPPSRCYIFMPTSADAEHHPEWGTMHSTGGMLAFVDCWDDEGITDNTAGTPVDFTDHPRDQWNSSSPANIPNPWGDPGDATMVDSWQCGGANVVGPQNAPGGVGRVQVSAPRVPPTTNTGGSAAGTAEYESDGFIDCDASTDAPASAGGSGNGQNSYVAAFLPYSQETEGIVQYFGPKIAADYLYQFSEGARPGPASAALGPTAEKTAGLQDAGDSDGIWLSTATISENSNPYVDRANLRGASPISPVETMSMYAFVSTAAKYNLQLNPNGKTGTYGNANCGGFTSGTHGGWDCASTNWYPGIDCNDVASSDSAHCVAFGAGNTAQAGLNDIMIRPGQVYNMLDVDCFDDSVSAARSNGVGWGVLTGTSC